MLEKPGPIGEWVRVEITPEGYFLRVMPGANAWSLPEVIGYVLSLAIPGVDYRAVKAAYETATGAPFTVSTARHADAVGANPPPAGTPSPAQTTKVLLPAPPAARVEQRGTEIFLTVAPEGSAPALRDVLSLLAGIDASRLDLGLLRTAIAGERGVAHRISRSLTRETSRHLRKTRHRRVAEGVLLACAEDHLRERLSETLIGRGLAVQSVASAEDAARATAERRPDVVLLTQPIGGDDALGFVRKVRAQEGTRETPVILIPAEPTREVVEAAVRCGVNDFLVRPVTPGALLRKVGKALESIGKGLPAPKGPVVESDTSVSGGEGELRTAGKIDLVKLARRVDKLLALPAVVQRVMSITADIRTGAKDIVYAVSADPAVSATVLRKANSAFYAKKERISDLQEAVVRIGFIQTRALVVGMSMIHLFAKGQKTVGFNRVEYWRHGLATGIVAKLLAERAAYPSPDIAFVSGLLHDIGKILLDEYYGSDFEQATLIALKDLVPMRVAERQVLGTDHAEVGSSILDLWKFPQAVSIAVARHHDLPGPEEGIDAQDAKLCRIVHVANVLAKALGEGGAGDQIVHEVARDLWDELGLWDGLPPEFWKRFDDELEKAQDFLDFGAERVPAAEGPRSAALLETTAAPVSVLGLALARGGWTVRRARTADEIAEVRPEEAQVLVVRAGTAEEMAQVGGRIRATSTLPIVGVLPEGQPRMERVEGFDCVVEPYDRLTFLHLLPGSQ